MKVCTKCSTTRKTEEFPKIGNRCKICTAKYKKQWEAREQATCSVCGIKCNRYSIKCRSCASKEIHTKRNIIIANQRIDATKILSKVCKKCEVKKPIEAYGITGKGYTSGKCKICISAYKREIKQNKKIPCPKCKVNKCGYDAKACRVCSSKEVRTRTHSTIVKNCEHCNSPFKDNSLVKARKYCSTVCGGKAWYLKDKEKLILTYGSGNRYENKCRKVLEDRFDRSFPTTRPDFLKNPKTNRNLELDGYCEELKLAFEYDGEFHYKEKPWQGVRHSLLDRQQLDRLKDDLCKNNGIILIRIPYWENSNLESYIKEQLIDIGVVCAESR